MKPNEQLSWALVTISIIALPKWAFAGSLVIRPDVLVSVAPQVFPMILITGICSLLLLDSSQPLSALFGVLAGSYATPAICAAGYRCDLYEVGVFFPAILWVFAGTYPDASCRPARVAALIVASFCLALFTMLLFGVDPYVWPSIWGEEYRSWEWGAVVSLVAVGVLRWRSGPFRLPSAKSKVLLIALLPPSLVVLLDVSIRLAAKVGGFVPPSTQFLGMLSNLALGWGVITLTRAEMARHKETPHVTKPRAPHR